MKVIIKNKVCLKQKFNNYNNFEVVRITMPFDHIILCALSTQTSLLDNNL